MMFITRVMRDLGAVESDSYGSRCDVTVHVIVRDGVAAPITDDSRDVIVRDVFLNHCSFLSCPGPGEGAVIVCTLYS
jgi:hypothetical protein